MFFWKVVSMKVLSIGNSFSMNAHAYLERMAAAGKTDMVLGNLFIGGCSLERHYNNMKNDTPDYDYQIHSDGGYAVIHNHTLYHALISDDWDVITFQQVSNFSGKPDTFEPYLGELVNYVRGYQPNAKLMLHETWAYEYGNSALDKYGNNPKQMYSEIEAAYNFYSEKYGFEIIPCGKAFEEARKIDIFDNENGGKSLCAPDLHHASAPHGQYLLGAVWYEKLTGKSILENPYSVDGISFYELMSLKKAARIAVNSK